jgi:hypothetical protein
MEGVMSPNGVRQYLITLVTMNEFYLHGYLVTDEEGTLHVAKTADRMIEMAKADPCFGPMFPVVSAAWLNTKESVAVVREVVAGIPEAARELRPEGEWQCIVFGMGGSQPNNQRLMALH